MPMPTCTIDCGYITKVISGLSFHYNKSKVHIGSFAVLLLFNTVNQRLGENGRRDHYFMTKSIRKSNVGTFPWGSFLTGARAMLGVSRGTLLTGALAMGHPSTHY